MSVVKNIEELRAASEAIFPFDDTHVENGVHLYPQSRSFRLWDALSSKPTDVELPTGHTLGTIETLGIQVALEFENEIKLHAEHCAIYDRIEYINYQTMQNIRVEELDMESLTQELYRVFSEWETCCSRAKILEDAYYVYRTHRLRALNKALVLCRKISSQTPDTIGYTKRNEPEAGKEIHDEADESHRANKFTEVVVDEWKPGTDFQYKIEAEMAKLMRPLQMTQYYKIQNCVSNLIRRPLFAPSELSRDLKWSLESDPYSQSPLTGSVMDRIQIMMTIGPSNDEYLG